MSEKKTCCAPIWRGQWRKHQPCGKTAKYEDGGRPYCGTHNPAKKREKQAAQEAEWEQNRKRRKLKEAVESAERAVIEAAEAWDDSPMSKMFLFVAKAKLKEAREALRKFKEGEGGN